MWRPGGRVDVIGFARAPGIAAGERGSRAAVLAAIEELGYRPNAAARTLARRQSHSIGVLVSDLHNPFFPMVLDGIDAVAEEHEYTSLIVCGKRRSETEEHALGRLLDCRRTASSP